MAGQVAAGTDGVSRSGIALYGRAAVGNAVFFQHWPTDTGAELWQADGAASGTSLVSTRRGRPGGASAVTSRVMPSA